MGRACLVALGGVLGGAGSRGRGFNADLGITQKCAWHFGAAEMLEGRRLPYRESVGSRD